MWKLLRRMALFLPIVLLMVAVNRIADPGKIFEKNYEEKAARLILSGKNVVGMSDYNARLFSQSLIFGEVKCPDTIIIGSSRVMELSDETIPEMGRYRNLGMSGAGVYDYMGILGMYDSKGRLPSKVIIGLDPWILNENNGEKRWQTLQPYIDSFEKTVRGEAAPEKARLRTGRTLTEELQLISPSYFQISVRYAIEHPEELFAEEETNFYATTELDVDGKIRYTDGSIEYEAEVRNRPVEEVNEKAKTYVSGRVYQMSNFDALSGDYSEKLVSLVDYLQSQNIEVVFFLPPFHPYVYRFLSTNPKYVCVAEAESFFRSVAAQRDIPVYGAYDPAKLSCGEECFFDGMHMKRRYVDKAWKIV